MAQASFEYSRSGTLPDQSRYSYTYSASVWRPTPEDLDLGKAIEEFASLGFAPPPPPIATSSHRDGNSSINRHDAKSRIASSGRVQDPILPGSYSGRYSTAPSAAAAPAASSSSSSRRPDRPAAVVAPRTIAIAAAAAPPPLPSELERRPPPRRCSRTSPHASSARAPLMNEDRALVPYGGAREYGTTTDDAMTLGPEDSVSQVSRSRPRRREGSVVSGQTIRFGGEKKREGGAEPEPEVYAVDGKGDAICLTRDVTPW
ncbi:Hypothetical predicted protein [Lecanosticta acicola]|uniref:Uncharacterized protein n=1 Tax=Lecanosticta acicola TaxID=111012 RepID=A0AAI9EFS2_9PEZI|nr:Hypothetical predicted protein [Lecanosticta acicola]